MPNGIDLRAEDGRAALDHLDEVADLYLQVYAEPPYNSAPKYGRARFLDRTRQQTLASGFTLITARRRDVLVGFAFGFSMLTGTWWANASSPPPVVLEASKFAVIELVVDRAERGHGIGRALLDDLLGDRPERYATLAAVLGAISYDMYLRWGWMKAGEFRIEPPFSDALVLGLLAAS